MHFVIQNAAATFVKVGKQNFSSGTSDSLFQKAFNLFKECVLSKPDDHESWRYCGIAHAYYAQMTVGNYSKFLVYLIHLQDRQCGDTSQELSNP